MGANRWPQLDSTRHVQSCCEACVGFSAVQCSRVDLPCGVRNCFKRLVLLCLYLFPTVGNVANTPTRPWCGCVMSMFGVQYWHSDTQDGDRGRRGFDRV